MGVTILDGATGTMLQAAGLPLGVLPESWNITKQDIVENIGSQYIAAGSNVIYANTFGVNRHKIGKSGYTVDELVSAGIRCARKAAEGTDTRVALDIGPIGQLLEPLGTLSFEEAYDIYKEIVVSGEKAGADLVIFETMSDLYEVKAAVLAAKENTALTIWVTMTFEATGRTFVGVTVPAMALTLNSLDVDAMGFNCSLGPKELLPMVEELTCWTDKPLILKPNAGLPDPATGAYTITPEEFGDEIQRAVLLGASIFGGCCGTNPEFIRTISDGRLQGKQRRKPVIKNGVCSATRIAQYGGVRIIGERINPTGKKRFQQALKEHDINYIVECAVQQQDAGADILDINVGLPGIDETRMMVDVVKAVQSVTDLPLQIDSSDPAAIEAGLRVVNGRAIVNSVNGRKEVLDSILPLCKRYGAAVVGLCLDENGIPDTWEGRIKIAQRIVKTAVGYGIPKEDVFIDCLTLTVSAQQNQARETLRAVRYVTEEMNLHTILGVSNISFGLPARENITVNFLTQAMYAGLDFPIVNPNQKAILDTVTSFKVLSGEDVDSEKYIERFTNEGKEQTTQTSSPIASTGRLTIGEVITKGLKEETAKLTREALETKAELDVVNELLIPALDLVGEKYEKNEIFLPQLINAANAACEGFEVIKARIAERGAESVSRGKILIATVHGDVHDIGADCHRSGPAGP